MSLLQNKKIAIEFNKHQLSPYVQCVRCWYPIGEENPVGHIWEEETGLLWKSTVPLCCAQFYVDQLPWGKYWWVSESTSC